MSGWSVLIIGAVGCLGIAVGWVIGAVADLFRPDTFDIFDDEDL